MKPLHPSPGPENGTHRFSQQKPFGQLSAVQFGGPHFGHPGHPLGSLVGCETFGAWQMLFGQNSRGQCVQFGLPPSTQAPFAMQIPRRSTPKMHASPQVQFLGQLGRGSFLTTQFNATLQTPRGMADVEQESPHLRQGAGPPPPLVTFTQVRPHPFPQHLKPKAHLSSFSHVMIQGPGPLTGGHSPGRGVGARGVGAAVFVAPTLTQVRPQPLPQHFWSRAHAESLSQVTRHGPGPCTGGQTPLWFAEGTHCPHTQ